MPHIVGILFNRRKSWRNKIGKGLVGKANNPHCRRNTQSLILQGLHSSNSRKIAGTKQGIKAGLLQEAKGTLITGFPGNGIFHNAGIDWQSGLLQGIFITPITLLIDIDTERTC